MSDADVKAMVAEIDLPQYETPPLVQPPPLSEAKVAIVTTAALHVGDEDAFGAGETGFKVLDGSRRDVVLGHWSPNFDRSGFAADLNVVYPVDRLAELADRGVIGSVGPQHITFAGNQFDETITTLLMDTGPAAAKVLKDDGVDIVLLTPV